MGECSRRRFLVAGLGLGAAWLAGGCASQTGLTGTLPGTPWEDDDPLTGSGGRDTARRTRPSDRVSYPRSTSSDTPGTAQAGTGTPSSSGTSFPGVFDRSKWATGKAIPSRMDKMLPVSRITVHHDGMSPFWGDSQSAASGRIDAIRRSHQDRGWGDIGYHFAIDRGGRIWEARSLTWQGAHVKYHNEGNIGVVCLGNFEEQSPTDLQVAALQRHVSQLIARYGVPTRLVYTHQELAATACPGRALQARMGTVRARL
ncbi:MAG: N-acetylmuramoyl-L-alanine amidase [Planctomycetes bacterium]|nr:N-acetylmuramoyl-L-alanine amidase [Planctomycetota bacterium]NOG54600.1 N-acetylmuramoyl-L-alanine amidase [Planctomycetota bacterium]